MRIEYNKDTPHFSSEELREIYRNTEEKTSKALRQTAHRLYPGRDSVTYENLFIREGYARAYMHKGEYRKPKWTITAWPLMLGVMDDDTIYDNRFGRILLLLHGFYLEIRFIPICASKIEMSLNIVVVSQCIRECCFMKINVDKF